MARLLQRVSGLPLLIAMILCLKKLYFIYKAIYRQRWTLWHLDDDVANIFKESEIELTNKLLKILEYNNINIKNPIEKIHIIIGVVENLCHEIVYHKHKKINYEIMENEVINLIMLLSK